jgi:hypothetical protein
VADLYELLRCGGLVHFCIGNGWFIRFCTGYGCLWWVLGIDPTAEYVTVNPNLDQWLWTGRPPGSYLTNVIIPTLEHFTRASLGTVLVFISFAITLVLAIRHIRKKAKKGAVVSYIHNLILKKCRPQKVLFISFIASVLNYCLRSGDTIHIWSTILSALTLQILHTVFEFDIVKALLILISIPGRIVIALLHNQNNQRRVPPWTYPPALESREEICSSFLHSIQCGQKSP